jgi:hypothetical protein
VKERVGVGKVTLLPTGTTSRWGENVLFFCSRVNLPGVTAGAVSASAGLSQMAAGGAFSSLCVAPPIEATTSLAVTSVAWEIA